MENLKVFFTRRPERLLGRCGMLFLMAFFVMNLSSCNDDFIEDDGEKLFLLRILLSRLFICYWMGPISRE